MKRLLGGLVALLPREFRLRFGPELVDQIECDYEAARAVSWRRAAAFTLSTAADLVRSSLAERWDPSYSGSSAVAAGFGGALEHHQRNEGEGMMRTTIQDLRDAYRSLRRAPGFTTMAAGTLALALGVLTAVFAVVDAVLLDPLPFAEPDRLVSIAASAPGSELPSEFGPSLEFVVQYRDAELLEEVTTYDSFTATFRVGDRGERIRMAATTPALFRMLGVPPVLGRLPTPEDEDGALVLSHALWVDWFGADPDVIGRSFSIFGPPRTVVAVMGPDFDLPDFAIPGQRVMLWMPSAIRSENITPGDFGYDVVARMADGADIEALTDELDRLAARLPERFGGSASYARIIERHRAVVRPLRGELLGSASRSIWILFGAVVVVLLIACANVTNLFLVRAERRQRDLAVRRAMGAGRLRLARAQLAEAGLVSVLAGGAGVALAWAALPVVIGVAPTDVHRLDQATLSPSTIGFVLLACFVSALLCGLLPALRAASVGPAALRDGARGSTHGRHWTRDGLVVGQTALALVLLVGSGLLVRSFQQLRNVDPGYDVEDVFTFQTAPEADHLVDGPSWAAFHHELMDRIRALRGVESVGLVENVPLNEGVGDGRFLTEEAAARGEEGVLLGFTAAGGDYFETMDIDVLRGRAFEEADHVSNLGNVVVSRSAAELLWPGENAIGQRVQWSGLDTWETVVGVVEDVMQGSFRDEPQPLLYLPMTGQEPGLWALSSPAYVVKTERAEQIAPEIRSFIRELAPGAPMYRTFTMKQLAADSMRQLSFTMFAVAVAAALALVLGAVGLYGVLSYVVAQRTREIGVRMALGAEAASLRRMVVAQGGRVVALGVVLGMAASLAATGLLGSLLYGVEAIDPITFAAVAAMMLLVGLLASYVPARRASGVDPVESLRAG